MLCYKGRTFCEFENCKKWHKCDSALTEKVKKEAEEWMENAPISVFVDKPECFKEKTHKKIEKILNGKRI